MTTAAQAAAAIRTELKNAFPGIKFRVTSENYTGGSSVRIEYVDGVKRERVERVVCKYEQGRFDGMTDCYDYTNSRSDVPQVKYIFVERKSSDETRAKIMSDLGFEPGTLNEWDANAGSYRSEIVCRQFQQMEFGEHSDVKNETELNAEREINGGYTDAIGDDVTIKFFDLFDTIGRGNAHVIDVETLNPEHLENIDPYGDPDLPTALIGGDYKTRADMTNFSVVWVNPKFRKL